MPCLAEMLRLVLLLQALAGGLPAGGQFISTPTEEDPEVTAFFKKKGWRLIRDIRISDGKPLIFLWVENRDKPFEDVAITGDDCKMIAKSKTVQVLDMRKAKNTDEGLKHLAGIPQLEGILVGGDDVTDAGVKELARAKSLETVVLVTKKVTDAGVKELAALPKLRYLVLMFMKVDGSAFAAFAGSKTLEAVSLDYVDGFTDDGAKHLAELPNLMELKIGKGFGETKLTVAGIKAIVAKRVPPKFDFDKRLIDDELLEALVTKGWLYGPTPPGTREKKPATAQEVKTIALDDSQVTDKGFRVLLNCTNAASLFLQRTGVTDATFTKLGSFKKLEYVALQRTKVSAAGLEAIAGLPIRHLAVEESELTEDSFKAMAQMTALQELWLGESKFDPAWLKHIAGLPKLKELNLRRAACDDAAAKHLAALPSLESLTLNNTKVGDAGFKELLKHPKLKSLFVDRTAVTKEAYQQAKKDHPKLRLYYTNTTPGAEDPVSFHDLLTQKGASPFHPIAIESAGSQLFAGGDANIMIWDARPVECKTVPAGGARSVVSV